MAKKIELENRRAKVAVLLRARRMLTEIAKELDVSKATITGDVKVIRAQWRAEHRVEVDAAQEQTLAGLAHDEAMLRTQVAKVLQKQDRKPSDYEALCAYQDRILKIQQFRAKVQGEEAPQKVEQKTEHVGVLPLRIEYSNDWAPTETGTVALDVVTPQQVPSE